ncbi:gamma-glutamyltransferase family protein [Natronorubrum sp. FCH18a]|uniref:gamma-glutamyltransferase family protein n=1 Tax=Natronorubrum sp. FCH18a TaxID=3447018 RepID=UPI003F519E14
MDIDLDRFTSRRSTVHANRGMVATSQPLAAEAGLEILRDGGNAFDAAVATAAALNVVEPTSTGLGGDVFALYRTADGDVGAMRSCGGAPADATIDTVRDALESEDDLSRYYPEERGYAVDESATGDSVEMPFLGPHAVTVPGTARGWEATVQRFGEKTLADALEPAIHYATEGYPVSEVIAHDWTGAEELFTDDHAREAYLVNGRSPTAGETVTLPRLGDSMRSIAERGADIVYEGAIAEAIADEVQSKGGVLTVDDLAAFEPEFLDPVSTTYNGSEIYELPPNNQGLIALEALNIAEEIGAGEHPYDSPERTHALVESLKLAFADGHRYITDPEYEEIPPLGSKAYAAERATAIGDSPIRDPAVGVPNANAEDADTVLLSVADEEGNVVSFINSRFAGFGSGLVAGDTGIALQNRGASFSLDPDHPNSLEPGKRPFHTLIPALANFGEDDWAAFGVMGGYMQPQGHLQIISNLVDYDVPLQAALDAPRWRYRESGTLGVEERLPNQTKLARKGHDVGVLPPSMFGGAQIVRKRGDTLSGATEPRKDGTVTGY